MGALATAAFEWALSVLAPPRCAACDEPVRMMVAFCPACAASAAPFHGEASGGGFAAFAYGGAPARAIARFKYEQRPDLARPLGDLLWRAVAPHRAFPPQAVAVPVPLHPVRLGERGYNQSALLAARLARRLGIRCAPLALARKTNEPRQATLGRSERRLRAANAFAIRRPELVRGRAVVLVDDVWTTGATLADCARCLHEAGADRVDFAVVARAEEASHLI
jgi:ComF family protein